MKNTLILLCVLLFLSQCTTEPKQKETNTSEKETRKLAETPIFNADSAYAYIEKQVAFGPRVPNSKGHEKTRQWLVDFLRVYTDTVIEQKADLTAFDGTVLKATNIIASFKPEIEQRVMLSAHWDTRPFADQDEERVEEAILGANDGGSGVAVLLEIARQLNETPLNIGLDIVLFDAEDYGQPEFSEDEYMPHSYCLGSQYWSKNMHRANYTADFGILLDMVGAHNAAFTHEEISVRYANEWLQYVWKIAHELGYGSFFSYKETPPITDDHLYVNQIAKIPTIDIIEYDHTTDNGFGWYWHTHEDDMEAIDRKTLKAVGQTVLQTLFQYQSEN